MIYDMQSYVTSTIINIGYIKILSNRAITIIYLSLDLLPTINAVMINKMNFINIDIK